MKVNDQLGDNYPLIINGKEIYTVETINSYNPAAPSQLIGRVSYANHEHADNALQAALHTFASWKKTPVQQRANYLRSVANLLAERRMEFAAWQIFEAGKNWQEADGDICEAIDFLNYYAQQAELIATGKTEHISGEHNHLNYKARGVSLVIPPWNFPLAILCGMLSASIVTGNTCILKPSSLTPVIAAKFMQLWQEVSIPAGVISFLPGPGEIIGEYLAHQPGISIIAFTGSLEVGTKLLGLGSQIQPGQHHIKKVIAEMGEKNAIIIDSDADLDDAVLGVVHSAFGFQGQKCSAASRVIVVGTIYKKFIKRLIETTHSLTIGTPENPNNLIGPVIDKTAYNRIIQSIKNGQQIATMHNYKANTDTSNGYYIKPCIFTEVDPLSPLAQEEIFGPVLCVIKADNFNQAIEIANNTRYALTGGVYSRQPSHLQYARENFNVGNLYLNRKTTGALVHRQPFGGFKMSGVGSKAGSADYLLQFMNAYCITENTLRRGFAPET
ncbi:MAG: L-glutamate gamma-semialdehyde dehydrogenase, partial [gamma proteobacterium symbiont of Bathyaustriella thionipta]|nr:L-glutamate gamma-semialdehyde dehydrogenase [gamma proteobacterium symbiont of Bathyaustriella thionipta]